MTTHQYGLDEQLYGNNYSTWYAAPGLWTDTSTD